MKKTLLTTAAVLALTSGASFAATLGTFTHDYGTGAGQVDPSGTDVVNANSVTVSDQSSGRFSDSFDFSGLAYDSIDSFELTLDFAGAGPSLFPGEGWAVRVQGSNASAVTDDFFGGLASFLSPQTITISAATDVLLSDAFANSVTTQNFEFWFSEFSGGNDAFTLNSATLTVNGTLPTAVPLPAGLPLMLLGLGGIAALRRRKTA